MSSRRYTVVILCAALSMCLLFMLVPSRSSPGMDGYNPWADINNDGTVDIYDAILLANAFNKNGQNLTKASVSHDSGWVNITDKQGQDILITHDLNISNWNDEKVMVDITGKTILDGELHRSLGLYNLEGWNKTYGGTSTEDARPLVQTSDGGYALAGYTSSYGAGYQDFWLVKTDASGNSLWNKTYGGTGEELCYALVQTSDGGYALAGTTRSFGTINRDAYLVKTDASGNMQWNKTYYGSEVWTDSFSSIVQTSDGGYVLAGATGNYGAGGEGLDFWLVKTDVNGTMQWSKTYGGTGSDGASALVQTADMGYALAGSTTSFGAGSNDFWLVKTDLAGNALWNKTYGGPYEDQVWALVQTVDGGYALAGITDSYGAGGFDFWLVRTDALGTDVGGEYGLVWANSTTNTITLHRGALDPNWNYVRIRILKAK